MAYEISKRLERLSQISSKEPQIIIEFEELDLIIGASDVTRYWEIGDDVEIGDTGLVIGGVIVDPKQKSLIDKKANPVFTQQLLQGRGGSGSTSRQKYRLVDKDEELTKIFSPGQIVDEPLYTKAKVYQSFKGGAHPFDSINTINGLVTDITYNAGNIEIQITSSEDLKKREIYRKWTSQLSSSINGTDTTISFSSIIGFIASQDILESYIIIEDEIIKAGTISGNSLTGCVRGQLGTSAVSHGVNEKCRSMYRFTGNAIEISLKMMLSTSGTYVSDVEVSSFVQVRPLVNVNNAIYFQNTTIKDKYGLVVGSIVNSSGASNAENNFSGRSITGFGENQSGTYFTVDGASLVSEPSTIAKVSFQSQFDTLPQGCGMSPQQVDIQEHIDLDSLLSTTFPLYDFKETKTIKAKEFIDEQVYYPSGLTVIPRKGRSSAKATLPPLALKGTKTFDETNIIDPDKIQMSRSVNKDFYNEIVYEFDYDPLKEETVQVDALESELSIERFPERGKTPLTIVARGLNETHSSFINTQQKRYLKRFQFGAESTSIKIKYGDAFNAEVGDTSIFGTASLQISDTTKGTRKFAPRLMEIQNVKNSPMKADFDIKLLDTSSTLDGRYAVIGPSSKIGAGSTTEEIVLKRSFNTQTFEEENEKWSRYIGLTIKVYNPNSPETFSEHVTLIGFKPGDINTMLVSTMSSAPTENFFVSQPDYQQSEDTWKTVHAYLGPEVSIVSSTGQTFIEVSGGDIGKFFVNSILKVHKEDYSIETGDKSIKVIEINGNILTVTDLGFTPDNTFKINLIGFSSDSGKPYRYF